ncbi:PilZ domain-containing protein [Thermodesulfobacteriota bacterium]
MAKRKVRVKEIVADLKSGMTNSELMSKYRLSSNGLQIVLKKLFDAKAIPPDMFHTRVLTGQDLDVVSVRLLPRVYLDFDLLVYEAGNIQNQGKVRDLTEAGLGVEGIRANVEDEKTLVIRSDDLLTSKPIVIDVRCRWARAERFEDPWVAGFQINDITPDNLVVLRQLIKLVSVGH